MKDNEIFIVKPVWKRMILYSKINANEAISRIQSLFTLVRMMPKG
jgi:hypothetical protein